jgi:preprotein translocase subunit SecY
MLSAFANCFKIPELRQRIIFTLCVIVVVRIGAAIPCPGINTEILARFFHQKIENDPNTSVVGLFNLFSGGALENCAVFTLGIIPYISASIMLQLMTAVVPSLSKLAREEGGRQKITQYTRYATIVICVVQGYFYAKQFENPAATNGLFSGIDKIISQYGPLVPHTGALFEFTTVVSLLAGTLLLMWLGEQITDKGIGNGISMVITINIVSRLPAALGQGWLMIHPGAGGTESALPEIVLPIMLLFLFAVIAGTIAITQAQRKVTIQYAKQVRGNKVYGGQTAFLPLKVNYSGVMPIIFAQSILIVPAFMIKIIPMGADQWLHDLGDSLTNGFWHYTLYVGMIFFFSYFWVSFMFNPIQIAEDVKRNGGFIPGVRPGAPTAEFLEYTMTRLTLAGAIFLAVLAILPMAAQRGFNVPVLTSQFFGGTSLLIMIGVMLDTMRQMETYLLQRHYDGFLKKGRIRGRSSGPMPAPGQGQAVNSANYVWLFVGIAVLAIVGAVLSVLF